MALFNIKFFNLLAFTFILLNAKAQTLIMNEVSNGPSGSQEYVEFVVVSNTAIYNCSSSTPPCIDIRGWIFDDNSGYHGPSGVAAGAIRFSQNSIWACVPLGSIILLYNDADKNSAITLADDLSMTDGNCRIIAPISNTSLFERNTSTPGAAACSYPSTGWVAGGSWSFTALANTSDCARIVNLAGCEVFSVCYGAANNLNTLIYFPTAGTGTVYSFNSVNPQIQANWSSGSAAVMQTPGTPNNSANAAYIAQFNNGCIPITQLTVTAVAVDAGCTCNGSATANSFGSIGGYTYVWYDASMNSIGQTAATATGLCAGVYYVTSTSQIGCIVTTSVTINSSSTASVSVNSQSICAGTSTTLSAIPSASGGTFFWFPSGATSSSISIAPGSTTTYTVGYTFAGCTSTNIATIFVTPMPTVTVNSTTLCSGQTATLIANGASTYSWSSGTTSNLLVVSPSISTTYSVIGINATCTNTTSAFVNIFSSPTLAVSPSTICAGETTTLMVSGANSYLWNTGQTTHTITVNPITSTTYSVSGTSGLCNNSTTVNVTVNQLPSVTVLSQTICIGQSATLIANGAASYSWSNTSLNNTLIVNPNATSVYTVTGTTLSCSAAVTATVFVDAIPTIFFNSNKTSGCAPLCIQFTDFATLTSGTISTWDWTFDDGSTSNMQNPFHCFDNQGSYDVSLTVTSSNGCSSLLVNSNMITVFPTPIAEFESNFDETDILNPTINFTNLSSNANDYAWNFGDTISTITNPTHTYDIEGTYTTTLTATNQFGCKDAVIHDVIVKGIFTFYTPNTFTPNEDFINDVFLPIGFGWDPDKYQLEIFDRWGNNCFTTKEVGRGWDGRANNGNKTAQIGTYTWKVELTDLFGVSHNYIGRIMLNK
jgi:gliding motility-associated-like protein